MRRERVLSDSRPDFAQAIVGIDPCETLPIPKGTVDDAERTLKGIEANEETLAPLRALVEAARKQGRRQEDRSDITAASRD